MDLPTCVLTFCLGTQTAFLGRTPLKKFSGKAEGCRMFSARGASCSLFRLGSLLTTSKMCSDPCSSVYLVAEVIEKGALPSVTPWLVVLGLLLLEAHLSQGYCSGMTKIVGQDSGTIAPGAGPFTEACSWEIKPGFQLSDPQRIVIGVRTWDANAKFTLSVYDGMASDGTLLYSYTQGSGRPREVRARLHSLATIVFTPEAGTDSSALELYWYTSVLCSSSETVTLSDQEGSIGSGPGPYKNTMACNWLVAPGGVPDGYHVAFKITMLDTAADDAYVRISNGNGEKLAQYSGAGIPSTEIGCPTASCQVYWHTGEVSNGNMHTGFALQYYLSNGDVTPVLVDFPIWALVVGIVFVVLIVLAAQALLLGKPSVSYARVGLGMSPRLLVVLGLLLLEAHLIQGYCSGMTKIVGQDSGTIAPGAGPFTEACSWEIKPGFQLSDPQRIVIGVRTWDANAAKFTLSVYDGLMSDGTVLYSYTEYNSRPGEVRASLHSLATIVFTPEVGTDSSTLEFYWYTSVLCNNSETVTLSDHEGTITSGRGPYNEDMACNWVVAPGSIPDGYHVAFKFTMLDAVDYDTYVRISNGNGEKLAQYAGVDIPSKEIGCPTAACQVYWHTGDVEYDNSHKGFTLQYYLSDVFAFTSQCSSLLGVQRGTREQMSPRLLVVLGLLLLEAHLSQGYCSGMTKIVGQDSGTIAPGAGPFTEACSWEIKPGFQLSDPQRIVIGVRTWDANAKFTLSVYDGMASDGTLLYSYTQGSGRPREVRARLHSLATIVFTPEAGTDSSALELYWYTSVLCSSSETVTLSDQEGSIGSGPGPYKNTMACNWLVAPGGVPDGYHVAFKITMLDTAADDAYVRISNGNGNKLAQYSGSDIPSKEIGCPTASCQVYWHTGEVSNGNMHTGFALQYYLSDGDITPATVDFPVWAIIVIVFVGVFAVLFFFGCIRKLCKCRVRCAALCSLHFYCGGHISPWSMEIAVAPFKSQAGIRAPYRPELRLVIGVHSLDTVANYSLQVYDGNTTETLLYNYTSGNAKPGEVRARQHTFATIVFIPAATATNVSLELYWYTSVLCGASVVRLADPEGNMTSGPGPYKDGMLCDWVVAPTSIPKGYHVAFLVTMLDTHSDDAYVQINDASDFLVAKFACTNLPSAEIGCPTEYCKVYWHTTEVSPANTHRGFAMRYYLSDGPVTPSGLHLTIYILMGISSGLFLFFLTCCSFRYWRKHPKCSSHWWWDCCVDSCCDTLCPCCQPVCRQKPPRAKGPSDIFCLWLSRASPLEQFASHQQPDRAMEARMITKDVGHLMNRDTWLISDTHFSHKRISELVPARQAAVAAANAPSHDEFLTAQWNSAVQPDDTVLCLGDFAWGGIEQASKQVQGKKILILGNHDRGRSSYLSKDWLECIASPIVFIDGLHFAHLPLVQPPPQAQAAPAAKHAVPPAALICDVDGVRILFSHYALFDAVPEQVAHDNEIRPTIELLERLYRTFQCQVNIHGHIHDSLSSFPDAINVSVERIGFRPVRLGELLDGWRRRVAARTGVSTPPPAGISPATAADAQPALPAPIPASPAPTPADAPAQ
ncbi:hypothetical protein PAPYR_2876 [Paratrimastix pyriformis]|uniref:CUB domain-containing protein n=1 Tax=Paratrimastix pyriformis TaxID=342808 RepID=A0ABQ8UPA6_9EUKA|nr:hypothetical protein PAPYR_2876 [Paratrimastix pyriformis]